MQPAVSVIVPIRNGLAHVPTLAKQLLALTGSEHEVIVVDDQSSDGTGEELDRLLGTAAVVRVLQGPGEGVAAARNLAVAQSRGEYLWFTDSDDTWEHAIVAEMLRRARVTDADVVVCSAAKVQQGVAGRSVIRDAPAETTMTGAELLQAVLDGQVQGHLWNKLIRRSVLATPDPFPPTRAHSDLGGLLRAIPGVSTVALLPEVLYTYHLHSGSILNSRSYRWADLTDALRLAEQAAAALGAPRTASLTAFKCTHVVLPLVHESVRRRALTPRAEMAALRRSWRREVSWSDVAVLQRRGQLRPALRVALFKASPATYTRLYGMFRRLRRAGLDQF